jgi:hypothetical protein
MAHGLYEERLVLVKLYGVRVNGRPGESFGLETRTSSFAAIVVRREQFQEIAQTSLLSANEVLHWF